MNNPDLADLQKLIFISFVRTLDADETIFKEWSPVGMDWERERESRDLLLSVGLDDDDDLQTAYDQNFV